MSETPIDLNAERNKRAAPDAEHIRKDDFGRPMYRFLIEYEMDGSKWTGVHVWAYSWEDAEKRLAALKSTAKLDGQAMSELPW